MEKKLLKNKFFHFVEIMASFFIFILLLNSLIGLFSNFFVKDIVLADQNKDTQNVISNIIKPKKENKEIKVAFVGDIMLDRGVYQKINQKGEGDFNFAFENIKDDLKKYDFLVGNLEGPVSDKGEDKHNLYSFRMDPIVVDILKEVGFGAVSVANNHINDWGINAMKDTFDRLNDKGIKVLGGGENIEDASSPRIMDINGTEIALLSFDEFGKDTFEATADKAGIVVISEDILRREIESAREKANIVIVCFHFGDEYQEKQNVYQEKYSKMAVDFGADLVVGHHPHVVQPIEQYKNVYIAYSLGNFIFDQYFSPKTMEGGLLEISIENKKISSVELKEVYINSDYQPNLVNK